MKHSKITAIVLTLCMLVTLMVVAPTAASATTTDANFVKDGSFEKWGATGEYDGVWFRNLPSIKQTVVNEETGESETRYLPSAVSLEPSSAEKLTGDYSLKFAAKDNASSAQHCLAQNLGRFPQGTVIKMSLKVKINEIQSIEGKNGYARLITRLDNNAGTALFVGSSLQNTTDGWQEVSLTSTIDTKKGSGDTLIYPQDHDIMFVFEQYNLASFEIYLDDCKVEIEKPVVKNGGFEISNLDGSGWTKEVRGGAIDLVTEDGISYVKISDQKRGGEENKDRTWISQDIKGLNSGKTYNLSFAAKSEGPCVYVDCLKVDDSFHTGNLVDKANTEGKWKRYSFNITMEAGKTKLSVRLMCLNGENATADGYAMFDDVVLREVDSTQKVVNGDFEDKTFSGWTTGETPEIATDSVTGNSYAVLKNAANEQIKQTMTGLTIGKTYILSFDARVQGNRLYVWFNDNTIRERLNGYTTNGWEHHAIIWTQAGDTDTEIGFRFKNEPVDGEYVWIDNVVLMEDDESNIVENGSFEYGKMGLGLRYTTYAEAGVSANSGMWQTYSTAAAGSYAKDTDCVDGAYSLKITDAQTNGAKRIKHNYGVTVEQGKLYEATFYVKDVSLTGTGGDAVSFSPYANGAVLKKFTAADLPDNEWVCIRVPYVPAKAEETPELRFNDNGVILVDNFSIRKVTEPIVTYTKANGAVSDALVEGGKVTITMPADAADQGNVYALALYNRDGIYKTLLNVNASTITEADVTAGYASFELTADTLGDDFANVNYAKLIMLKGGSYQALQEYDLLLKAAQ